jgi:hypothetical protein
MNRQVYITKVTPKAYEVKQKQTAKAQNSKYLYA